MSYFNFPFFRGYNMKKKIVGILIVGLLMIPVFPGVNASIYKIDKKNNTIVENTIDEVYSSGWICLLSSNIQGVGEEGKHLLHFGYMSNITITATYQNTFFIRTKPIWGSAIVLDDVDIQIQMKHFFGMVDIYRNSGEIIGYCEDVSWKII
jgi:hypothetical protein